MEGRAALWSGIPSSNSKELRSRSSASSSIAARPVQAQRPVHHRLDPQCHRAMKQEFRNEQAAAQPLQCGRTVMGS